MSDSSITFSHLLRKAEVRPELPDDAAFRPDGAGGVTTAKRGLGGWRVRTFTSRNEKAAAAMEQAVLADMKHQFGDALAVKAFRMVRPEAINRDPADSTTKPVTAGQVRQLDAYVRALQRQELHEVAAQNALRYAPDAPSFHKIVPPGVDAAHLTPNQKLFYTELLQQRVSARLDEPVIDKAELREIAAATLKHVARLDDASIARQRRQMAGAVTAGGQLARAIGTPGSDPVQLAQSLMRFHLDCSGAAAGADELLAGKDEALAQAVDRLSPREARALFAQAMAPGGTGRALLHAAAAHSVFAAAPAREEALGDKVAYAALGLAQKLEDTAVVTLLALGARGGVADAAAQLAAVSKTAAAAAARTLQDGGHPGISDAAAHAAGLNGAGRANALLRGLSTVNDAVAAELVAADEAKARRNAAEAAAAPPPQGKGKEPVRAAGEAPGAPGPTSDPAGAGKGEAPPAPPRRPPTDREQKAATDIQRVWRGNRAKIQAKFMKADAAADKDKQPRPVFVTTSYAPAGQPAPGPAAPKGTPARMVNYHFRDEAAAKSHGMPSTMSMHADPQAGPQLGKGGTATVFGGPRDFITRILHPPHPFTLTKGRGPKADPTDYAAELDCFVPSISLPGTFARGNGIAVERQIARNAGPSFYDQVYSKRDAASFPLRNFQEISGQLAELHRKNIYHLDIKPENMTITARDGQPPKLRFIDTDGMVKYRPGERHGFPEQELMTVRRTDQVRPRAMDKRTGEPIYDRGVTVVPDHKADDEYTFAMLLVTMASHELKVAYIKLSDAGKSSRTLRAGIDRFVESAIKPEFRDQVRAFLRKPWQNVLTGPLHDMIDWENGSLQPKPRPSRWPWASKTVAAPGKA